MPDSIGILSELPPALAYLIEPAMKYGRFQFDDEVDEFLRQATEEQIAELTTVAQQVHDSNHDELIGEFLDRYPITDYEESANLYFLFGVIDAADVAPEPDNWNSVEKHVESLGKHGSYRLASERMWAARFLAEFRGDAKAATPDLRQALDDEDHRVRVWAHYALAAIEGSAADHRLAIEQILSAHQERDELGLLDDVGTEATEALAKFDKLDNAEIR